MTKTNTKEGNDKHKQRPGRINIIQLLDKAFQLKYPFPLCLVPYFRFCTPSTNYATHAQTLLLHACDTSLRFVLFARFPPPVIFICSTKEYQSLIRVGWSKGQKKTIKKSKHFLHFQTLYLFIFHFLQFDKRMQVCLVNNVYTTYALFHQPMPSLISYVEELIRAYLLMVVFLLWQ